MICIIASKYKSAERWANSHLLLEFEWFYPTNKEDIRSRKNFQVVVADGDEIPNGYLNEMLTLAWKHGRQR